MGTHRDLSAIQCMQRYVQINCRSLKLSNAPCIASAETFSVPCSASFEPSGVIAKENGIDTMAASAGMSFAAKILNPLTTVHTICALLEFITCWTQRARCLLTLFKMSVRVDVCPVFNEP